jgi:Arc/MetJ family transcription regulator
MPIEKVSLSLDASLLAQARKIAGTRALSALVNDALRVKLQHERMRSLLAEMDEELGPIPADELERARKTWRAGPARRR